MLKSFKLYMLLGALALITFPSCDREATDDLRAIIKEDLGYLPVISGFTLVSPSSSTLGSGTDAIFDLRYWSEGTIDRVELWETLPNENATLLTSQDYAPAYSNVTRTDSLLINYSAPVVGEALVVVVEVRVYNQGLEGYPKSRAIDLTINP
jgi:hypothetical protein